MAAAYKAPGVYIVEKNAFPNSVVEVATAVPAFLGYTEKGPANQPTRLSSMSEFITTFGGPPPPKFKFALSPAVPARQTLRMTALPTTGKKVTINTTDFTFSNDGAAGEVAIGTDVPTTLGTLASAINAAQVIKGQVTATVSGNTLLLVAIAGGADGNNIAIAPVANSTPLDTGALAFGWDGPTLTGGLDAGSPAPQADATVTSPDGMSSISFAVQPNDPAQQFRLYYSMKLFFQNGGGPCYVVSVGSHTASPSPDHFINDGAGISTLEVEPEPTMLVIPDAVLLNADECITVQQQMLLHCGATMKNRFAILDVYDGFKPRGGHDGPIDQFRNKLASSQLHYGAAYYPWVNTTLVSDRDLSFRCFQGDSDTLAQIVRVDLGLPPGKLDPVPASLSQRDQKRMTDMEALLQNITDAMTSTAPAGAVALAAWNETNEGLNQSLLRLSPAYKSIATAAAKQLSLMPPSGVIAGVYSAVDNSRGVWKAPANVPILSVTSPAVKITSADQEDLNVTPMGKSINAIRSFIGEGSLVWGARTLDGNSLDWRYINVRRTMIMLEESCKLAAKAMVFEPNVAGTWLSIRSMIENFLTSVWKRGGLAGAVPADAFSVHCGLGDTMTADDILEGYLNVTVLVAVSRPAEFIEITFQQQQQKS